MNDQQPSLVIRDISPNMKKINLTFIVLEVSPVHRTKDGNNDVRTVKIADRSGCINLSVWNEPGEYLQAGDICQLTNGYAQLHKSCLSINCGRYGELQKIGEFCFLFSEVPDLSLPNPEYARMQASETERAKSPPDTITSTNGISAGNHFNGAQSLGQISAVAGGVNVDGMNASSDVPIEFSFPAAKYSKDVDMRSKDVDMRMKPSAQESQLNDESIAHLTAGSTALLDGWRSEPSKSTLYNESRAQRKPIEYSRSNPQYKSIDYPRSHPHERNSNGKIYSHDNHARKFNYHPYSKRGGYGHHASHRAPLIDK